MIPLRRRLLSALAGVALFADGKYATRATDTAGETLDTAVKESGGKAANRLLAKPLAADPDTLDSTPDGTSFKRVAGVSAGNLVQTASIGDVQVTTAKIGDDQVTPLKGAPRNRCRATRTTSQSITTYPTASNTVVNWDSETYDTGALHDNATNNSRITVPTGGNRGVWLLTCQIEWSGGTTGSREVRITKNGSTVLASALIVPGTVLAGSGIGQHLMAVDDAPTVGDYYEVDVTQSQGSSINVQTGSWFAAQHLW